MLTWRHSFNIHTIAPNSGGKNEVQLRTLSHLPLWCVWCQSRQFVPVRLSGSMVLWAGTQQAKQARQQGMGKWWPWFVND